jgi:predicted metal-dependent enzyme (double-stranded beta helix superfamily)
MSASVVIEQFIADCRAALVNGPARVQDLVARTVGAPLDWVAAIGEPQRAGLASLYRAEDLTILHVVWPPKMENPPHDHRMWAVIGVYAGCEVNRFWCRAGRGGLLPCGTKTLHAGGTMRLDCDVIHSVANPLTHAACAIHVYGGDFFAVERSEWENAEASEERFDMQRALRRFDKRC